MSSIRVNQDRSLSLDEEQRLHDVEREKDSIEAGPHNGFADAVRVTRLNSEIEALEERVEREKQLE